MAGLATIKAVSRHAPGMEGSYGTVISSLERVEYLAPPELMGALQTSSHPVIPMEDQWLHSRPFTGGFYDYKDTWGLLSQHVGVGHARCYYQVAGHRLRDEPRASCEGESNQILLPSNDLLSWAFG